MIGRVDWPERKAFMAHLDGLKRRAGIEYDSSLAVAAGLAEPAVEHWRSGRRKPSLMQVARVAEVLDESPADLVKLAGLRPVEAAPDW